VPCADKGGTWHYYDIMTTDFYYNRSLAVSEQLQREIMATESVRMGVEVKDRVTGLRGIVTGKTEYINGCVQ